MKIINYILLLVFMGNMGAMNIENHIPVCFYACHIFFKFNYFFTPTLFPFSFYCSWLFLLVCFFHCRFLVKFHYHIFTFLFFFLTISLCMCLPRYAVCIRYVIDVYLPLSGCQLDFLYDCTQCTLMFKGKRAHDYIIPHIF